MSANYTCDKCNKNFRQKKDLTDHKKRKTPCISLEAMQQMADNTTNEILQLETRDEIIRESRKLLNKNKIINIFKSCLNILRDNETLTGEKALRNLSYLLTLKLIEPQIGTHIDIDNYEYNLDDYGITLEQKIILLNSTRYSNLKNVADADLTKRINTIWEYILSTHPLTKNIFLKDKKFDIKNAPTFIALFKKLDEIDTNISNNGFDILGASYEEVIKDIMVGKVLGQYFTQPLIKKLMIKLLNPQLKEDGTFESVADPTMGTGGFLISYLNEMIKQSKELNIPLNTEFIKSAIYGREIESDTYQLAVSNMLISSGFLFENFECGDSIRTPITRKFDNILANPPFGIKRLKYVDFNFAEKDEYIPIQSDNAVSLFIQLIIYMLKIDGKCAIVLPDGQDLFSKSNHILIAIREYLLKTCDLQEVIYMPSGIFTNTGVKTCVFFFVKKREGTEVITIHKTPYRGKEKRTYTLVEDCTTELVKFYNAQINASGNELEKTLLIEVPISDIKNNSYSLNYAEYVANGAIVYNNDIEIKSLDELFNCKMGKFNSNDMDNNGTIPFYTCSSENPAGFHSIQSFDYLEYLLLVCAGGSQNNMIGDNVGLGKCYYVNGKTACRANVCALTPIYDNMVNIKYVYYYLNINRLDTNKNAHFTTNLGTISLDALKSIQIPIPSLGHQHDIIEYLDFIHKSIDTSNQKISELKQSNAYYLNHQAKFGRNEIKKLSHVCTVNQGTYITREMKVIGEYPVYGGGDISSYINQFNREDEIIIAKDGVSLNCVRYEKNKFFLNHHGWTLMCKELVIKKFIYYYLESIQKELLSIAKGAAQLGINQENFYNINIPIPELARQSEIVSHCEKNDLLIAQLESEIESNKIVAKEFLTMVLSTIDENLEN
jgi:type I restriction enzyme M protein